MTEREKTTKGCAPWRFKILGAPEHWAGKQWEQAPPAIESYATHTQKNAWGLKMGLETGYAQGLTPQRIFHASSLLWDNNLGCLDLFEDAMLVNPGYQFFSRDGDGFCFGSPLQKVQWICTIFLAQVQIMLYPDESMVHYTSASGSATYPGQEYKLQHMKYVFDNFLLVSKNTLASKQGMFVDSEEALAETVV